MQLGSNDGAGRAVVIAAISIILAAAAAAFWFLTPPDEPRGAPPTAPPAAARPVSPVEVPKPAPEPHRRSPRVAPMPAAATPAPAAAAAPTRGVLEIDSDVPGASVFIDRVYLGTTPVTAKDITPGRHQLNASVQGYDGIAEPIDVEAGEKSLTVRFKEVRLDAAIDVVHKHGIGSCRGRLVATPDGIRYDTANKGDAFSAPLAAIEEISVDYLKKNLRLKVKGRTYNFTDPGGNADRLFVFQRDVEKARQKLAAR